MSRALLLALLLATPALGQSVVKGELSRMQSSVGTAGTIHGEYCGSATVYGGGSIFGGGDDGAAYDSWIDVDFDSTGYGLGTSPDVEYVYDNAASYIGGGSGTHQRFVQVGAAALKPHLTTENGRSAVVFDGSDDYMTSIQDGTVWKFAHDGTKDYTWFIVARFPGANPNAACPIASTSAYSVEKTGFYIFFDDRAAVPANNAVLTGPALLLGTDVITYGYSSDNAYTADTPCIIRYSLEPGATGNDFQLYVDGVSQRSAEPGGAYNTGNAEAACQLGASNSTMVFCAWIAIRRILNATEIATMEQILSERWGTP